MHEQDLGRAAALAIDEKTGRLLAQRSDFELRLLSR
jgi:hypothetical protein